MRVIDRHGVRLAGAALRALMPRQRQRLSVLIYHRVLETYDELRPQTPLAEEFRAHMETLARLFNVLDLGEAVERLRNGDLPARAAAVSFDDGYADNLELAQPILAEVGVPATVFVATGFLNGGRMFNDTVIETVRLLPDGTMDLDPLGIEGLAGTREIRGMGGRRALIGELLPCVKYADLETREVLLERLQALVPERPPDDLMMTDGQVRRLHAAGVGIGAHTVHHPILKRLDVKSVHYELSESKRYLERLLEQEVTLFAYPNGKRGEDYDVDQRDQVRDAGFRAACSTHPGTAGPDTDPYQLPRFTPWDRDPGRFAVRMALNAAGRIV